jgi:predicted  nucleic acid-binding Zn ribbon protein
MVTAELRFAPIDEPDLEAIESLLAAWYKNGQVLEWQTAKAQDSVRVLALLPKPEAVAAKHNNVYASTALQALVERSVVPIVEIVGTEPDSFRPCCCDRRSSLVMFTTYLSKGSPVRCGDCFGPVPLYELPPTHDHEHLNILQWSADYRACDTLQMHCTTGERFGERQLGAHDSSLSRNGRGIAAALSALTDIPVYYCLFRARGSTVARERRRLCPSCGGTWLLNAKWHDLFDFRCDSCRLLSNIAYSLVR